MGAGASLGASALVGVLLASCTAAVDGGPANESAGPAPSSADDGPLSEMLLQRAVRVGSTLSVELTPDETAAMRTQDEQRHKVGIVKRLGATVSLSGVNAGALGRGPKNVGAGAIQGDGRGGFTFTTVVQSPGASKIRVHITNLFLPQNTELYAYNAAGDVDGPYTGRGPSGDGELWTSTLDGDEVVLQVQYAGTDTDRVLGATRFVVADVGHVDGPVAGTNQGEQLCSFNAACVENASCNGLPAAVAAAQTAVAEMLFASGRYLYICTGGLLADTDASTDRPLFLTAAHCVSRRSEARSLETFFNFITPCNGACQDFRVLGLPGTNGASILSSGNAADYSLLELDQPAPAGATFLGWDPTEIAFTNGVSLYRISHPSGAPQAYSEHEVDVDATDCGGSWARGNRIYSRDVLGATEGAAAARPC
jgi:hypothetical protein